MGLHRGGCANACLICQRILVARIEDCSLARISWVANRARTRERRRSCEDGIITPLGLHLEKNHKRRLERMRARNRTEKDLNVPRRQSLTTEEKHFIRTHSELEREFEKLSLSDDYT